MLCIVNIKNTSYNDVGGCSLQNGVTRKISLLGGFFRTDRSTVTRERAMKNQIVSGDV